MSQRTKHTKGLAKGLGADEPAGEDETDFGFARVPEAEKPSLVRAVFDSVAPRYDLMNDLMSAGVHRLWRAALIDWLLPRPGTTLVDIAGGTGDVARRFLDRVGGRGRAMVCDASPAMLEAGRARHGGPAGGGNIAWLAGDAEALPLAEMAADACTIAFGLRNVTRKERALAEAWRVLKPGGRFLCLEFSHLALPLLGPVYDRYSFTVVPWLGEVVARDREAYNYLVESIRRFPDQETLAGMLAQAGFERVSYRNLSGGVAAMHSGWRL